MNLIDIILITAILLGAGYLFYRSIWKKGGACAACHVQNACKTKRIMMSKSHENTSRSMR